jgi:ribosomal protein S27AE
MTKTVKSVMNKCKSCGNSLIFNPDEQGLCCVSCHSSLPLEKKLGLNKHDLQNEKELISHKNTDWAQSTQQMKCSNCGANVILQQFDTTSNCPYCDTQLIASQEQFSGLKPDSIIPFRFGKTKAEELFKNTLKNKWLVSSKFKKAINADEIQAYYFPSFAFDAECSTTYHGMLYNEYTVRDKDGNTKTEKRHFPISGIKNTVHSNLEIEASAKLTQYELNSIRPYNFAEALEYRDEFAFGYGLECYSNSLDETFATAKTLMDQKIKKDILSGYNYDGISTFSMNTSFNNPKYNYCMLPIYRFNYSHKNKQYSNIMNGQTGKLGGKYPKSGFKIALIVFGVLLLFLPFLLFIFSVI